MKTNSCIETHSLRACVARRVAKWTPEEAKDRLYSGNAQSRFQLLGTGDWPASATWFDVAFDTAFLHVSVMALQAGNAGLIQDGYKRDSDYVEVFFDPFCDRIGYGQFIAGSEGALAEASHWPYRDPKKDRHRDAAWSVTIEEEPQRPDVARFFFFRFDLNRIRARDCIGFNVGRTQSRIHENSMWNLCEGIGFPDAGCFGRLWFVNPPASLGQATVDIQNHTLKQLQISGLTCRKNTRLGARLVDPTGKTLATFSTKPTEDRLTFRPQDPVDLHRPGRYRIILSANVGDKAIPVEPEEFYFDQGGTRRQPFQLQGTYDWPDHVWNVAYTPKDLEAEMRWYKDCGLNRVYWLDYTPEMYCESKRSPERDERVRRSLKTFGGDFLKPAVRAAHKAGMEFVTIFKPFDLGIGRVEFLRKHPHYNIRRNPAWTVRPELPIRAIRIYQCDESPFPFPSRNLTVWQSRDNRTYRKVHFGSARESVVQRAEGSWSPRGHVPGSQTRPVRCLQIEGLAVNAPFCAVTFEGCDPARALRNRAYLMAEFVDASGAILPYLVNTTGAPEKGFDLGPCIVNGPSWGRADTGMDRLIRLSGERICLGLSIKQELLMPGFLEPTFPAVQAFWLASLKRGLDAGADGVSLRLAHHMGCADWLSYMYAEPVLEEFRRRTGRDPEPVNEDYTLIRRIRGESYTGFLREASAMAHKAGRKFLHHIENRMLVPPEYDTYSQIHWDWQTWIREKLFDEIDLKYIGSNHPDAYREIAPLARKAGMKVNVITAEPDPRSWPRSIEQGRLLLREALESGMNGIDLYELWLYHRWTDRGYPMVRGCGEAVIREMRAELNRSLP